MSAETQSQPSAKTIVLAGHPNVGKSTLFNVLTGSSQKIANYPGVTVEKKIGTFVSKNGIKHTLIDLPGTYSLNAKTEDEKIAVDCITGHLADTPRPDVVLVVGEAYHLDRVLYLFKQIQNLHPQAVLVLNMMDELKTSNKDLDLKKLQSQLNAPVFGVTAKAGQGLDDILNHVDALPDLPKNSQSSPKLKDTTQLFAEIDALVKDVCTEKTQHTSKTKHALSEKLDRFFLNPVLGPIAFLAIMALLFQSLFTWSGPLMDLIDGGMGLLAETATDLLPAGWLQSLVVDGVIGGVGSVIIFVPQIAIAFLLIGILENSGYLSRGAFLIDRLMRFFGLEGRSFIPLVSSSACAVPGILATRTIPNAKQRLITILVAPLMICSARLPVYTLLIATFVPASKVWGIFDLQGLTFMGLFFLGVVAVLFVSLLLNLFLKTTKSQTTFVMELPRYRLPSLKNLYLYVSKRTWAFIKTAGSVIFVLSLVLWALAYFPHSDRIAEKYDSQISALEQTGGTEEQMVALENQMAGEYLRDSFMGKIGLALEPAFKPMGADWRMGIGLLTSFAAREVFVSTLGIVFNLGETDEESESLRHILLNTRDANGALIYSFPTAIAVLVFFALAAQCISTLAVIKRETGSAKWAYFAFGYMSVLAYVSSVLTYQFLHVFWVG